MQSPVELVLRLKEVSKGSGDQYLAQVFVPERIETQRVVIN